MNKIITLLICLFLVVNLSMAQNLKKDIEISVTPELDIPKKDYHLDMVELEDGNFIAIEGRYKDLTKSIQIVKFNKGFKEIGRTELNMEFGDDQHRFNNLIYAGGEVYIFTSFYDKKNKNTLYLGQRLDQKTLRINGDFVQLGKVDKNERSDYLFSEDGSKLLFCTRSIKNKKNELIQYSIKALNANNGFSPLWEKEFKSDQIDQLEDVEEFDINNQGEVYLLTLQFKDKRRTSKKDGDPNYSYRLKEFSNKGSTVKAYDLKLQGKFISDLTIGINQNDDIVCTGFYSDEGTYSIKGSFYMLFDHQKKAIVKQSTKEFGLDFITENLSERKTKKVEKKAAKGKNIEVPEYDLKGIVMRDDGSVIQVAERYFVTVHSYTDSNGNTTTYYVYHYNELIVISIDTQGEIEWIRKIRKVQSSRSAGSSLISFHLLVKGDKMYFVHNGNAENLLIGPKDNVNAWKLNKKAAVIVTEINSEGYLRQDILMDYAGYKLIPQVRGGLNLEDDDMLFFAEGKKGKHYIRVKIND